MLKPTAKNVNDEEDDEASPVISQSVEQTHFFRGKPLARYSFAHRAAWFRLAEGARMAGVEECIYFVYLLLTRGEPEEVDALRSKESLAAFRLEAGEWAVMEGVADGEGWDMVHELFMSIVNPVKKAESSVPISEPGRKSKSPNG